MEIFLHLYDDNKESRHIKLDKTNNKYKTNLAKFNAKFYYSDLTFDSKNVTDYTIRIEKANEFGVYQKSDFFKGAPNTGEKVVEFNACSFGKNEKKIDGKYRIFYEFYSGGVLVYDGKTEFFSFEVKTECSEFKITFDDAIVFNNVVELQSNQLDINSLKFTVEVEDGYEGHSSMEYSYELGVSEPKFTNYNSLINSKRDFEVEVLESMFENACTFLNFSMKDVHGNIRNKKIKIVAKDNSLSIFEISNGVSLVKNISDEVYVYFFSRFVDSIKPVANVTLNDGTFVKFTSEITLGMLDKKNGYFKMDLLEHFPKMVFAEVSEIIIYFNLNNTEDVSNEMKLVIDSAKPVVSFTNLDSENYTCVKDKINSFKITGIVVDKNMFFLEEKRNIFEIKQDYRYTVFSNDSSKVRYALVNGNAINVSVDKDTFFLESEDVIESIEFFDINDTKIDVEYISDSCLPGYKKFFIALEKERLSLYERNIVENNNGLLLSCENTSINLTQRFINFNTHYIIECQVPDTSSGFEMFELSVDYKITPDVKYLFNKYIDHTSCSSKIDFNKKISLDFDRSITFLTNSAGDEINILDNGVFLNSFGKIKFNGPNLTLATLNDGNSIVADSKEIFVNSYMNFSRSEEVYHTPVVKTPMEVEVPIIGYKLVKTSDEIYTFEFALPINEGSNDFNIQFADAVENISENIVKIEKNPYDIEFIVDQKFNKGVNVYPGETTCIHSRNEFTKLKLIINNESIKERSEDAFVKLKNKELSTIYKVTESDLSRVVYVELINGVEYSEYEVFYGNNSLPSFIIKNKLVDKMFVESESEFEIGSDEYYISYNTEDFSINTAVSNSSDFIVEKLDKVVKVMRKNSDKFLDEVEITITSVDKNMIFPSASKLIKGVFFDNNIVKSVEKSKHGEIIVGAEVEYSSFDILIKTKDDSLIDEVFVYDRAEREYSEHKKVAKRTNEGFVIENITTPTIASSLEINFKIKGVTPILRSSVFKDEPIYLKKFNYEITMSSYASEDKLVLEFFDRSKQITEEVKVNISLNGRVICSRDTTFDKHGKNLLVIHDVEFDNKNLIAVDIIFPNKRVFKTNTDILTLDYYNSKISVSNLEKESIYNVGEIQELDIVFESGHKGFELSYVIKDMSGFEQVRELNEGKNPITLEPGVYEIKAYAKKFKTVINSPVYKFEVVEDKGLLFELIDDLYTRIKLVNMIKIENFSNIHSRDTESVLLQYNNGNFIQVYTPVINDREIIFNIVKKTGNNRFVYKNKFVEFDLPEINY